MTMARKHLVDLTVTRWYHCISRCVRAAFLIGAKQDRKQWIEDRLERLNRSFAISVGGFAVMDNHLHILVRLDPDDATKWSAAEVLRRWIAVYPPQTLDLDDPAVVQMWIEHHAKDTKRVEQLRQRLTDLGWFMKALKEPLSRLCNRADGVKGTFWEARYKSIAILDEEALLATCAYIDLNPVAAGIAQVPERSDHTSVKQRVSHARQKGMLQALAVAREGSVAASHAAGSLEQDHWLVPIEDRRQLPDQRAANAREGMVGTFSLGSYLLLIDYTGRLYRQGKARISAGLRDIFERLGTSAECWSDRIKRMLCSQQLRGNAFGTKAHSLARVAEHRHRRTANLSPQLA